MKALSVTLLIGLMVTLSPLANAIEDASLVLYMPFEEGSGNTTADLSGKGNNGTLVGGVEWTTGRIGNGLAFNGQDSMVEIPSHDTLQADDSPLTIEAWIQGDAASAGWARVVDKYFGTGYVLGRRDNDTVIGVEFVGSPNSFASTTPVFDNEWHHVAMTREVVGATNALNLYIDGTLEGTVEGGAANQRNQDTTPVRIGAGDECCEEGGNAAYWFLGIIDEVAIYKKVLTADEIAQDMNGVRTAVEPIEKLVTTWARMKNQ